MPRAARKSKAASGGLASGPVAKKSKASEVTDLVQPDSQSFADNVKTAANVTAIVAGVSGTTTTDSKDTLVLVKDPGLIPCDNLNKNQAIRPEQLSMEPLTNLPGMTPQSQALLPSLEEMMNWPGSDPISGESNSKPWFVGHLDAHVATLQGTSQKFWILFYFAWKKVCRFCHVSSILTLIHCPCSGTSTSGLLVICTLWFQL